MSNDSRRNLCGVLHIPCPFICLGIQEPLSQCAGHESDASWSECRELPGLVELTEKEGHQEQSRQAQRGALQQVGAMPPTQHSQRPPRQKDHPREEQPLRGVEMPKMQVVGD